VKQFHAVIRMSTGVKGVITEFHEDPVAQLITADTVIHHSAKEFCVFLHHYCGLKL
ncbi:hypothetical protein AAVH_43528, partial [Aphelenchoides avenae]